MYKQYLFCVEVSGADTATMQTDHSDSLRLAIKYQTRTRKKHKYPILELCI